MRLAMMWLGGFLFGVGTTLIAYGLYVRKVITDAIRAQRD